MRAAENGWVVVTPSHDSVTDASNAVSLVALVLTHALVQFSDVEGFVVWSKDTLSLSSVDGGGFAIDSPVKLNNVEKTGEWPLERYGS